MLVRLTQTNPYKSFLVFFSYQDSCHDWLLLRGRPRLLWRARPARLRHGRLRRGKHRTGHQGLCVTQFPHDPCSPFVPCSFKWSNDHRSVAPLINEAPLRVPVDRSCVCTSQQDCGKRYGSHIVGIFSCIF